MSTSDTSIFSMSPGPKLAVFIGLTGICLILGGFVSFSIVAAILHVHFSDIQSIILQPQYVNITQFANALASIIAFGLPSIGVALLNKDKIGRVLGFSSIQSMRQVGLVILIAMIGLFLSASLGDLTTKIPIPVSFKNWATQLEDQYKKALYAMMQMKSMFDLLFALIAVAVIPAIVEELYFRATLQKILSQWIGKPYLAIVITAVLFSAFHFSYFGFLSRMSLGIIIGLVYHITKTIWLPMLMHFINNAIGVSALYFLRNQPEKMESVIEGNLTYYWAIIAIFAIIILCRQLKNNSHDFGLEKSI
ncbi:MAG: CPBP family intramembrane metalloprotease [Bacteroidetes bacterium]|nr:CPBP family intramembrane metalloprotease [Bacteroidota bacterium]